MLRFARDVAAALLALTLAAVPLIADWCAVACESAHAAAPTPAPVCHHAAASTPRIGDVPTPCGHDHRPVIVDAATTGVTTPHGPTTRVVPPTADAVPSGQRLLAATAPYGASDPPLPTSLKLSSILRV